MEDASLVVQVTAITRFSRSRSEDGKLNGSGELSDRYILEKVAVTFWVSMFFEQTVLSVV